MFEIFFLIFFGFIIFIIIFSTIKEKDFSKKVSLSLQNKFPNLDIMILSQGGFLSNPHIRGVAKYKEETLRYIEVKVKVYYSGKHRHEDLIVTAHFLLPDIYQRSFSVLIKKEGFFKRIFGGENVKLGHESLDDRLYIKASDPFKAKSLLNDNNFLISSSIARISDLKECKIIVGDNDVELYIRSDKVSARYVESLINLVQSITLKKAIEPRMGKLNPRNVIGSISEKISYPIVKSPRFQPRKSRHAPQESGSSDNNNLRKIKEKLREYSSFTDDPKIESNSALIKTTGFFKEIELNWTKQEIKLQSRREAKISPSFQIWMAKSRKVPKQYNWNNSFEEIDLDINPTEISEDFTRRYEISRYFNELTGDHPPPQVKIEYDKGVCQVSLIVSSLPENINPMMDLVQALGWFIEFSYVTYY